MSFPLPSNLLSVSRAFQRLAPNPCSAAALNPCTAAAAPQAIAKDLARFSKAVKFIAFKPFGSAADALEQVRSPVGCGVL